jgi:hypothetical protein
MQPDLAVGYLRQYRSMTSHQLAEAEERLAELAQREGLRLGKIFVEQLSTDPAAFNALIRLVQRRRISVVIVGSSAHLSSVGQGQTKLERIHHETDARVLVIDRAPALRGANAREAQHGR